MTVQPLQAQSATDIDPDFQVTLFVSLLGLAVSLALLPLLGGEFAMVLALAG